MTNARILGGRDGWFVLSQHNDGRSNFAGQTVGWRVDSFWFLYDDAAKRLSFLETEHLHGD